MFSSPIIIYGLVFAAVLLLTDTLLRLLFSSRRSSAEVKNRLESLKVDKGADIAYTDLLLRRGISGGIGGESLAQRIQRYYAQTGLEISKSRRVLYFLALLFLGYAVAEIVFNLNLIFSTIFSMIFTIVVSSLTIYILRSKRIKKFNQQLPPGIDIIVRSLNAGHPLNAAIALLAREMPDPIGSEFGILNDQMTFGSDLDQAMQNMIERVGAPELNLLAVTVSVQRNTGGNLSEILENLAQMMRDRLMIKAKIRAISAEGRFTSWLMMLFPFFLFAMIYSLVPTYFDEVWESGYGEVLVIGCLVFMAFGMIVIRRLVNFDF
ncbi:type II secretion system F family protein [Marimonas lutisalis]|uniref:type II secretion system F family protein n=1 Tax=Marimonas lutisalis TaxID=2545756 RepID=UPI0010F84FC6|nr:type II secretion system F family protein [Marimonas lutisalis]